MLLIDYLIVCVLSIMFVSGVKALLNEADKRDEANLEKNAIERGEQAKK